MDTAPPTLADTSAFVTNLPANRRLANLGVSASGGGPLVTHGW